MRLFAYDTCTATTVAERWVDGARRHPELLEFRGDAVGNVRTGLDNGGDGSASGTAHLYEPALRSENFAVLATDPSVTTTGSWLTFGAAGDLGGSHLLNHPPGPAGQRDDPVPRHAPSSSPPRDVNLGEGRIEVDGVDAGRVSFVGPERVDGVEVFDTGELAPGDHTIKMVPLSGYTVFNALLVEDLLEPLCGGRRADGRRPERLARPDRHRRPGSRGDGGGRAVRRRRRAGRSRAARRQSAQDGDRAARRGRRLRGPRPAIARRRAWSSAQTRRSCSTARSDLIRGRSRERTRSRSRDRSQTRAESGHESEDPPRQRRPDARPRPRGEAGDDPLPGGRRRLPPRHPRACHGESPRRPPHGCGDGAEDGPRRRAGGRHGDAAARARRAARRPPADARREGDGTRRRRRRHPQRFASP